MGTAGSLTCDVDKLGGEFPQTRVGLRYRENGGQAQTVLGILYCSQPDHFAFQVSPRKMHGISTELSTISKLERLTATF